MSLTKRRSRLFFLLFLIVQILAVTVLAAECSKTKLCATGCCSSAGYCGTTKDHCGKGCLSTCDFKTECDKNNPCKGNACCSKFGHCGLGPDFCGKDCVAGCDAKGECDPGGFGSKFSNHTKCPLNVCCSKHGYCGTTKDFCGKKTVNRPSCSTKGPMRRVVGYIEGWASTRSCDKFRPSDIPDGVYTHINFAFASIDPKTFQIVPASSKDPELYRELTRKKKIDPKLKVFIAIGGWAFNDPGPTVTTFSDIARSDANQRTFIKSLISFMATYDFDGVDIDWEYPAADDRQGREEDFDNLPKFLGNIKRALKQSGERNGLSIAIPASYWYLQHFDLEKITKHVDHFNVMTYDFHGAWDTPKSWLGNHLNSHTNLTEIKDAFDLLWRNKVNPDQVNMGLAFYARTFDVANTGCMSPGCAFSAGGPKESCTDAVGVMSNPEIMRKLGGKIGSGDLDKTAAVKTLKFGRTWLTYDDVDTWKLKLDFARSQCLGGAMVWAISQDTSDGKFSKQLQVATGYKSKGVTTFNTTKSLPGGVFIETTESEANTDVSDDQCYWTNCAKTCPSGWSTVKREDPYADAPNREIMTDDTACDGKGTRTFCCPPGKQPVCQWENYNNGDCHPGCSQNGELEVASLSSPCKKGLAQTACCRGETTALDVYRQYQWYGKEPKCAVEMGEKPCGWDPKFSDELTSSWSGSGAQTCYDSKGKKGRRPLCEDSRFETKPHFTNCEWSDDFNLGITDIVSEGQCSSNCPSGKVKVTLDSGSKLCGKGTSAYCCDVGASFDYTEIDNGDMEDLLKEWAKNPTCPNLTGLDKLSSRSLDNITLDVGEHPSGLTKRGGFHDVPPAMAAVLIVQKMMKLSQTTDATKELREMVDRVFTPIWPHLTGAYIAGRLWDLRDKISSTLVGAWNFVCNMDAEEDYAKNHPKKNAVCHIPSLDKYDPSSLEDPRDKPDDTDIMGFFGPPGPIGILKWPFNEFNWSSEWTKGDSLAKRGYGKKRKFDPLCLDGTTTWSMWSSSYPTGDNGDFLEKKTGDKKRYWVDNIGGDCFSAIVMHSGSPGPSTEWITEHIIELQTIPMFMEYTMGVENKVQNKPSPSGLDIKAPFNPDADSLVSCSVWVDDFQNGFFEWNNQPPRRNPVGTPQDDLFKLLGSTSNFDHLVNVEAKFNGIKGLLWSFKEPVSKANWESRYSAMDDQTVRHALEQLMLAEQVFPYLKKPDIEDKLKAVHEDVLELLDRFEFYYRKQRNSGPLGLSDMWRNFMAELLAKMQEWAKKWLAHRIGKLKTNMLVELNKRQTHYYLVSGTPAAAAALDAFMEAEKLYKSILNHENLHVDINLIFPNPKRLTDLFILIMDPNLELYRSILHLSPMERRQRMQHLPQPEHNRVRIIIERENHAERLQEKIAGRDIVQMALTDPSEITTQLKYALLGRTTYQYDENKMVERIANDVARTSQILVDQIAGFDRGPQPLPLDAWKLVYCDVYYVDCGSTTLQDIYEARLQEDRLQTPAARAREIVRDDALKKARRNAKWMIPAIERLSADEKARPDPKDEESYQILLEQSNDRELTQRLLNQQFYKQALGRVWKQVSPMPPAWMQHILDTRTHWGFVYYLSRHVNQKHVHDWKPLWSGIKSSWTHNPERNMRDATWWSIHCQGEDNRRDILEPLLDEDWPIFSPNPNLTEDDDLRKHFKEYTEKKDTLLSPGILRNTFIVIPTELLPELSEDDEFGEDHNLDPYWVWAYDADWDNSEETVVNGEKYQGRVRVAIYSLSSWFYAARWEGVSLRDMWLKSQQHPEKLWICYTKKLEEWDHEPYV
ncbi:hypothetical protein HG530_003975 [Fusarium avenaceum]|nr:hypothetical protein HG530_003975 [Fusarium avenaceum]